MDYDQRPKTRIYTQNQVRIPVDPHNEQLGFTQPIARPKGMLDGISMAQVIAGAAAAATSMMLASKIGIAGSVIGAAVSSAVTIICSQLYRRALDASAEKLKNAQLRGASEAAQAYISGAHVPYGQPGPASPGHESAALGDDGETPSGARGVAGAAAPASGEPVARIAPTKLQARAAAERSATQRKVVIASLAIAVLAVTLTAGIILASTAGEGLGHKTRPLFQPAEATEPAVGPAPQDADAGQAGAAQPRPEDPTAQKPTENNGAPSDWPQNRPEGGTSDGSGQGNSGWQGGGSGGGTQDGPGQGTTAPGPTDGSTGGSTGGPSNGPASGSTGESESTGAGTGASGGTVGAPGGAQTQVKPGAANPTAPGASQATAPASSKAAARYLETARA